MSSKLTNLDWLREDPFFKKHFPFKTLEEHLKLDSDEVDQYVENAIRQATMNPAFNNSSSGSKLQYEHLDTHNLLITKDPYSESDTSGEYMGAAQSYPNQNQRPE